ncbi:MAG: hypothetical protein N2257_09205 [Thermodesulfovibrionales bacterium]|nr:hypothetical protein [Thermodesulfovibrionales bacterium]
MPTKKSKKILVSIKKKIKFDKRAIIFIIGVILFFLIIYLFLKDEEKIAQKGLSDKYPAAQKIEVIQPKSIYIPTIEKAWLELITSGDGDVVRVVIEKKEPDVEYSFQWKINGKIIENYDRDSITGFKEGDTIGLTITSIFKDKEGQPRVLSLTVHSTVPKVMGMTEPKIENDIMVFKILMDDATKEGLIFSLIEAPKGMVIDNNTGDVKWNIKDVPSGRYEGKALIKNKKGAEVLYPFSINLS